MSEHAIDVMYVPVCGVCDKSVCLNDDEVWVHCDPEQPPTHDGPVDPWERYAQRP